MQKINKNWSKSIKNVKKCSKNRKKQVWRRFQGQKKENIRRKLRNCQKNIGEPAIFAYFWVFDRELRGKDPKGAPLVDLQAASSSSGRILNIINNNLSMHFIRQYDYCTKNKEFKWFKDTVCLFHFWCIILNEIS